MRRLAIYVDQPFWYDGTTYSTNAIFIKFLLSLDRYFSEIHLFAHTKHTSSECGYIPLNLGPNSICIHSLPFVRRSTELYKHPLIGWRTIQAFYDAIDCWDIACIVLPHWPGIAFYEIARRFRKPVFFYLRSNFVREAILTVQGSWRSVLAGGLAWIIDRTIRKMIKETLTLVVGDELYSMYKPYARHIHKIYPTVLSATHLHNLVDADNSTSAQVAQANSPFRLVSVGRLTPEKGIDCLIEAVAELLRRGDRHIICDLVGTGKAEKHLKDLVKLYGLERYFVFHGFVEHGEKLLRIYRRADVYVLPSLTEGIPKTLFEALAMGTPVIATNVGGISEIVQNGETGLLIQPGHVSQLAEAISRLMRDSSLRSHLSANGKIIVRDYTLEMQIERLYGILSSHFGL